MTVVRRIWLNIQARLALTLAFDGRRGSRLRLSPLAWRQLRQVNQRRIRSRCVTLSVSQGVSVARVLGRYKMFLQSDDHGHALHLMFDGYWELPVTEVVASLVRPGMVVVDAGANQGYFTLLMAGLVEAAGHVHAVEPNPCMTALLRRTLLANALTDRVSLHPVALGADPAGRVVLHVPAHSPSGAFVQPADSETDSIAATTLDRLLDGQPVDFIKIDAEGAEVAIWAGMRAILAHGRPLVVVMEFIVDRAPDAAGFLAEVAQQGFSLAHVHARLGVQPVTAAEILAARASREWILVLRRPARLH